MSGKIFCLIILIASPFFAANDRKFEEMRIELGDLSRQLQGQKSEIDLLTDQLQKFQNTIEKVKEEKTAALNGDIEIEKEKSASYEKRISSLEKSNKTLIADLKTLREHLNTQSTTLTKCEEKLSSLDTQLSLELKSLKGSLESMVSLLQGGEKSDGKTYIVKPGDSLGKIAQDHHITLRSLKETNNLSSDQIVIGQKLALPK